MSSSPNEAFLTATDMPEPYRSNLIAAQIGGEDWPGLTDTVRCNRLTSAVGNTALLDFEFDDVPGAVHLKAELANGFSGTHYDRLALLISELLNKGALQHGDIVVEASSGSCANAIDPMLAAVGIRSRTFVPQLPANRLAFARAAGADLVVAKDENEYIPEVVEQMNLEMKALIREKDTRGSRVWRRDTTWHKDYGIQILIHNDSGERRVYLNHSANMGAARAMSSMATEVVEQMGNQKLNAGALAIGNFLSIVRTVPIWREAFPGVRFHGVESYDNSPCHDEFYGVDADIRHYRRSKLLGASAHGTPVAFKDLSLLDSISAVTDRRWQAMEHAITAAYPTLHPGATSLACLAVVHTVMKNRRDSNAHYLVPLYDDARKYKNEQ